jgi:hypothetical protein
MKQLTFLFFQLLSCTLWGQSGTPDPKSVAENFFNYYTAAIQQNHFDDFTVRIIPGAKGMTALDTALYFSKLRQLHFFSNAFFQAEIKRLQPCMDTMAILPFKEYLKNDEPESYQVQCPFFMSYPWFFGLDFFKPERTQFDQRIVDDQAEVTLLLKKGSAITRTVFQCHLEAGQWKITSIVML